MSKKTAVLVIATAGVAFAGLSLAQDPADQIKYRQNVMKAIGGNMGAIAAIMQGKVEHKSHLKMLATALNADSKAVRDIFPEGSDLGETNAKPEIWQKPDEFKAAVEKLETNADKFLAAVDSGDQAAIGEAMKALGGSCKGCHDDFRQKKE